MKSLTYENRTLTTWPGTEHCTVSPRMNIYHRVSWGSSKIMFKALLLVCCVRWEERGRGDSALFLSVLQSETPNPRKRLRFWRRGGEGRSWHAIPGLWAHLLLIFYIINQLFISSNEEKRERGIWFFCTKFLALSADRNRGLEGPRSSSSSSEPSLAKLY